MSRRQPGTLTVIFWLLDFSGFIPNAVRMAFTRSTGISMPSTRGICDNRRVTSGKTGGWPAWMSVKPSTNSPPATSRINWQQRRLAQSIPYQSTVRSNRYDEGLCRFSAREVVRTDKGAN